METGAGNTEKDIDFNVKKGGDVYLTCEARTRSVVTAEADRTQHGRTAGRDQMGVVVAAEGPGTGEEVRCYQQ